MLTVTSKKFKPIDWPCSNAGTDYLQACVLDRYTATIEFYFEKKALYKRLKFDSATKTITNYNNIDFESFITLGFLEGEKIKVVHSGGLNQGELTITKVEERVITVSEALTNETAKDCSIYVTSDVTDLEFYYNLSTPKQNERRQPLGNAWGPNNPSRAINAGYFNSDTDSGVLQRYTATALDCEDLATQKVFSVGTDSYGWVTDFNPVFTGTTVASYIIGMGLDGYKQKFKIVHTFVVAPFFLASQFQYFDENKIDPEYLSNSLGYQFQINAKYSANTAVIGDYVAAIEEVGKTGWYDQNVNKTRPEYTVTSIRITDAADSSTLERLDFTKVNQVEINLRSATGQFVSNPDTGTQIVLSHLYCPLDTDIYEGTLTNIFQNYLKDYAIRKIGQTSTNGIGNGTAYQAIKNFVATIVDANNCKLNFDIDYSTQTRTFLAGRGNADRNYVFVITTQDKDLTTNEGIDRVAIRCGFDNVDYTQKESTLLELVDYMRCYHYPAMGVNPKNNIKGWEGLPVYIEVPFRINTTNLTPILKTCGIQIIATKTGKDDFVLEEKIFTIDKACNYSKAQKINIEESRNFHSFDGDPYNIASLARSTTYDTGAALEKKGFLLHYGFVLRYEDWMAILSPSSECPDIQNDNENLTQRWANIAGGWALKARFVAEVEGTGGFVTEFRSDVNITISKEGAAAEAGPVYTPTIYFLDEDGIKIDSIRKGGITKVIAQFEVQPINIAGENKGNTADATLVYNFNLTNKNAVPYTLRINTVEGESFSDFGGAGVLIGSLGGSGTINYDTGAVQITYGSQPLFPRAITANYSYYPELTTESICGMMYADQKTATGGIAGRRFANTDFPSEEDSPWSAPAANSDVTQTWAIGNLRVNLFGASKFTVEGNYKESDTNFGARGCGEEIIHVVVSINIEDKRLWDDLEPHLWDDLSPAAF